MHKLERALGLLCLVALVRCSDDPPSGKSGPGDGGGEAGSTASGGGAGRTGGTGGSSGSSGGGEAGEGTDGGAGGSTGGEAGSAGDSGTNTIGPDGGEVSVPGASVSIPARALTTEEEIAIQEVSPPVELPEDIEARSPTFAFTPHGLEFARAATISIDHQDTADTVLRLDDESDTTWEPVTGVTFEDDVAAFTTSSFSYYVVGKTVIVPTTVAPLYPTAPGFNDYVKNDGVDFFRASGTACDTNYGSDPQTLYRECIHSGEHRVVPVPGRTSCAGLLAVDALDAFEWTCEVLGGTATMVSTGFKEGAGLSTLLDFTNGAWRENSVEVSDGSTLLFTTVPAVWWSDPIELDNDGMTTSTPGTIYLVTEDSSAFYRLTGNGSALVVEPGVKLTGPHTGGANTGRLELGGAFGLYFEGTVEGSGDRGVHLNGSHHYLRNVRISGFVTPIGPARRSRIEYAKLTCAPTTGNAAMNLANGNVVRRVKLANCINGFAVSGFLNVVEDVFTSGGSFIIGGPNQVIAGITAHHSPDNGIEIANEGTVLMHLTAMHNLVHGLEATSTTLPNRIIGLLSTENRIGGIYLDQNVVLRSVGSFANTHAGIIFNVFGTDNVFEGAFATGLNGDMEGNYYTTDGSGCFNPGIPAIGDCYGSRLNTMSGSPNGLLSLANGGCAYDTNSNVTDPFNPPLRGTGYPLPERVRGDGFGDTVNPSDGPDGNAPFASITNWIDFENFYRGWGSEGPATPSCDSQGPCTAASTGPAGCQIFDYRLRYGADTLIARVPSYPNGDRVTTHAFSTSYGLVDQARCTSFFKNAVYDATARTCTVQFLLDAREILGDMRGNDNLLCESDEVCLYTPNLASYQGEGAIVPPMGHVFVDGIIENVTLLAYETNGAMMPYSP